MQANKAKDYALVALDMDGTLLNTAHQTTPYTRDVLRRATQAGKIAALATGRCLSELRDHLESMPGIRYVICENGACIYDALSDEPLHQVSLPEAEIEFVFDLADEFDVCRQAFMDNQSYIQCTDEAALERYHIHHFVSVFRVGSFYVDDLRALYRERRGGVGKINIYFTTPEERLRFRGRMAGRDVLLADSIGIGLEISPSTATKARGLEALCGYLHLPVDRAMAVGDGANDVDIMKVAGLSVAMGNAIDEIRALASVVTEDCDHDGAAKAIERYMMD